MAIAVVKIINRRTGKTFAVKAVLDYIQNPEKTEDGELCSAKDCLLECAYEQMLTTKLDFHQDTGRQYIHIVQSFSELDKLDAVTAHEIGVKLLNHFEGFQGVIATHTDRKQLHNHIVLNSVDWQTGRKWQSSKSDLYRLREASDRLCIEYGLSVIDKSKGWQQSGEYRAGDKSWKRQLAQDIADCLEQSSTRQDFLHNLDDLGLDADFGKSNIMFYVRKDGAARYGLSKEVSCENKRLMCYGDFSKDNIENTLNCNNELIRMGWSDVPVLQEALLSVGAMFRPDDSGYLQQQYFDGIDFKGLTKREIEDYLKRKELEKLSEKAKQEYEQQQKKKNLILPTILLILEEVLSWQNDEPSDFEVYDDFEDELEL